MSEERLIGSRAMVIFGEFLYLAGTIGIWLWDLNQEGGLDTVNGKGFPYAGYREVQNKESMANRVVLLLPLDSSNR